MKRDIFEPEHDDFRASVRGFLEREAVPQREAWEQAGVVDRAFWKAAADMGFVGFEVPERFGGLGLHDFRFNAVVVEESAALGLPTDNFMLQNDVVTPYMTELTTPEQQERWLERFAGGELVTAIAMTEPGTGSDLRAIATRAERSGDEYVVNGSKTFISMGIQADLVIVAARTKPEGGRDGFSLIAVEADRPGFERGRKLEKVGRWASDTAELFFNDVRVPAENLMGTEGHGLRHLMTNLARERLAVAVGAVAAAEYALAITLEYVTDRTAFGQPVGSFQANRHALAQVATRVAAARVYVDRCIVAENAGTLDAAEAAGLKALTTDLQWDVVDLGLQLHGGYGYMNEYEISRQWRDARVQRIYGGANEIMWEIVGRRLGL
jgi:alkylation response protein AidB-like acyl-CoA dehydrogenase